MFSIPIPLLFDLHIYPEGSLRRELISGTTKFGADTN